MTLEGMLYSELGALSQGLGLQRSNVGNLVGPELRQLCGIDQTTTHRAARTKLTTLLARAFGSIPDDYALAAKVTMALEPDYYGLTLTQRQQRLANSWNVTLMTVRRRSNIALQVISAHLAEHGSEPVDGNFEEGEIFHYDEWYTITASTTMRLDKPTPEATETRKIIALKDGLCTVAMGLGLPRTRIESRPRMGLEVEMLFGGELESNRQPSAEYFVHYIRFPRPLARGEMHTFGKTVRIPPGQAMAPHFVSRPLHRVDRFELRVKFDLHRLPKRVWMIAGFPYYLSEASAHGKNSLAVDSMGEVSLVFDRLKPTLGYGVRWLP